MFFIQTDTLEVKQQVQVINNMTNYTTKLKSTMHTNNEFGHPQTWPFLFGGTRIDDI